MIQSCRDMKTAPLESAELFWLPSWAGRPTHDKNVFLTLMSPGFRLEFPVRYLQGLESGALHPPVTPSSPVSAPPARCVAGSLDPRVGGGRCCSHLRLPLLPRPPPNTGTQGRGLNRWGWGTEPGRLGRTGLSPGDSKQTIYGHPTQEACDQTVGTHAGTRGRLREHLPMNLFPPGTSQRIQTRPPCRDQNNTQPFHAHGGGGGGGRTSVGLGPENQGL